jgi:hypothetical protein
MSVLCPIPSIIVRKIPNSRLTNTSSIAGIPLLLPRFSAAAKISGLHIGERIMHRDAWRCGRSRRNPLGAYDAIAKQCRRRLAARNRLNSFGLTNDGKSLLEFAEAVGKTKS